MRKEFVMDENPVRLDLWLADRLPELSRSQLTRLFKAGQVMVSGKPVKAGFKADIGQVISLDLVEERPISAQGQAIDLDIVYEDEDILVVNKPQGMVVHPAPGHPDQTLVNALVYHCQADLSDLSGDFRPGIVHRLDKDTSGLLLVAKNNFSHRKLADALAQHQISRVYHAVVWGKLDSKRGKISAPIGRDPDNRQQMAVVADGREAVTYFELLAVYRRFSLLELSLATGRTHQIRVHCKFIGHPVVADPVYAGKRPTFGLQGQALAAVKLAFAHPRTGKRMHFELPDPGYIKDLIALDS